MAHFSCIYAYTAQRNANLEQQLRISNATIKTLLQDQDDDDDALPFADGADVFMTPQPSHTPSPLARRHPLAASDDTARLRLRDVLIEQLKTQNKDLTSRVEALASSNTALREQVGKLTHARDSHAALQSSIKQLRAENRTLKEQAAHAAVSQGTLAVLGRCVAVYVLVHGHPQVSQRLSLPREERDGYRTKCVVAALCVLCDTPPSCTQAQRAETAAAAEQCSTAGSAAAAAAAA